MTRRLLYVYYYSLRVKTFWLTFRNDNLTTTCCFDARACSDKRTCDIARGNLLQSFVNRIFVDSVNKMKKTVESSYEFPHSTGGGAGDDVKSRTYYYDGLRPRGGRTDADGTR